MISRVAGVGIGIAIAVVVTFAQTTVVRALQITPPRTDPPAAQKLPIQTKDEFYVAMHRLAENGDADIQYNLGTAYESGRYSEQIPHSFTEAMKWYRRAADQGHAAAMCAIGTMYSFGHGVQRNDTTAVEWYLLAADKGHALAQSNLGVAYQRGTGVSLDYAEAMKWFMKAAEQNEPHAQSSIGGLDPLRWTSFQRGIRCPDRWPTHRSDDPVASSPTSALNTLVTNLYLANNLNICHARAAYAAERNGTCLDGSILN